VRSTLEAPMNIHQVDTGKRREVRRFIRLPYKLYEDCPQWVPPILPEARRQLDRRNNPYYQVNDAAFFLAARDGEDVGRICVMHPRHYNDFNGTQHAFFYLFDSIDDQAVADALFDAAADWAVQRGLDTFRGPLGFMAYDGFGMLAEGFEHRPAIGFPYNHAYYPKLAENWGFKLEERVLSGYIDLDRIRAEFPRRILDIAEKVRQRYGFEIKTYPTKRAIIKHVAPHIAEVYNRSLTHIAGDPPLSPQEVSAVIKNMIVVVHPRLLKFIVDKEGEFIGFMFCFLDISAALQRSRGRLFPFGLFHVLLELRRTDWVNFNGMGILPEHQGFGGTAIMYASLLEAIQAFPRFKHGDVVGISEFNPQSLNEMKKFGVEYYKTHHVYRKGLG
jgi:GNAT superfamily N-acetyltransferase